MATSQHAWVVYANQMFPQGLGYPLWIPEPDPSAARQVALGDVGWLSDGAFFQLFNSRVESAEEQLRASVPDEFEPFNPPNIVISGPMRAVAEPPLCSQTVKTIDISGAAQASGPMLVPSAGVNFSFTCTDNSGALLMFSPKAVTDEIMSRRHIITYMSKHFEHWLEFANGKYGLDLKEEHIMFVSGTTKTARWAVAALHGNYKKKSGSVSADLSSSASLNMSVSISNEALPQTHRKFGPSRSLAAPAAAGRQLEDGEGRGQAVTAPEPCDQCIFFHYYQMKRRLWFLSAIKAAAGPHELPPSEDDDIEASRTDNIWNPVNALLDYILKNSEAAIAIASDLDLYALFKNKPFPSNIADALDELSPNVEVDDDQVGTVVVDSGLRVGQTMQESTEQRTVSGDISEDDSDLASGGEDVDTEDIKPRKASGAWQASIHEEPITVLAYSPDSKYVASGSEDMSVVIWDVLEQRSTEITEKHEGTITALAFSRDNSILASGSSDRTIRIFRVESGNFLKSMDLEVEIHALAFSPDGTKLIAGTDNGTLLLWNSDQLMPNTTTDAPTEIIDEHHATALITFIVFSPDGRYMATGGTESSCSVWDWGAGKPVRLAVLNNHSGMVIQAVFAPDGERIVTASDDGTSRVWKTTTGEELVILHGHSGPVWAVAFSPDGRHVASGSTDKFVRVCDSYSGDQELSLDGHDDMVNALEFSPDGKYIATASSDRTVRLWQAKDGESLVLYNEHSDNVTVLAFAPDGSTLASGSDDGTVHIRTLAHVIG